ncbi:hypothetical protein Y032_0017g3168 [Ancylostoma ceylanicum]|uniref:Reverse transcriptase domain-containing protein n=1 Tax=Ancylostoma ceylanicum TaxID=53326 RepID=A0A016V3X3_9BILA|nr:hypothetical protein Y032_0017g3168 [Ancylostoma ceylanicum]
MERVVAASKSTTLYMSRIIADRNQLGRLALSYAAAATLPRPFAVEICFGNLTNTQMFLNRLRTTKITGNCVVESFDVNALYTNVSNDSAMQAIFEVLSEHAGTINPHGFSVSEFMLLLKACLDFNVFPWYGKFFAQIRGLAMGQRQAPTLAIASMAKIELPALECRPLLYCRYIDGCFVV